MEHPKGKNIYKKKKKKTPKWTDRPYSDIQSGRITKWVEIPTKTIKWTDHTWVGNIYKSKKWTDHPRRATVKAHK